MTRQQRCVNSAVGLGNPDGEIGHAFDRDRIGRSQPARRKTSLPYLQVGRQQLQPPIGDFALNDRGRDHGDAQPLDRLVLHRRQRRTGVQAPPVKIRPV